MPTTSDFIQVLSALMSTNNDARKEAEKYYQTQLESYPLEVLSILLEIFANKNDNIILRTFSLVLLRRGAEKCLTESNVVSEFRERILACWRAETNNKLCTKLAHVLAQVSFKTPWDTLLPNALQYATANPATHSISALELLEIYADYCPEDLTQHYQSIAEYLSRFFNNENAQVRMHCAKATAACVSAFEDDNARNSFKPALQPILNILGSALQNGDEIDATNLMEHLVTVAQLQPLFFKENFDVLVNAMLSVGNNETLEFSTRTMALELLVTLSESAPAIARKSNKFIDNLFQMIMKLLLEVDDDENDWKRGKYSEDDSDEDAVAAEEAIERLANGLGGKSVTEIILNYVKLFSQHPDWRYRRAAIASICRLAEGATKYFAKYISHIVDFLLLSLQDSSVRVQFEAIQTIGRLAAIYPASAESFTTRFLPVLATLMQNPNHCAKIRGHAASALINILNPEYCESEYLQPFVDPLLQAIISCLQSAPYEVRSPCLVVVGCVAHVCPDSFLPYYAQFMPGIKSILIEATAPEFLELRGKAMECAGLIGEAVGIERFATDALEIMKLFAQVMRLDADRDITFEYILPACARIAKALKENFIEFLPMVYEPLLQGAQQDIQFSLVDAEEEDVDGEVTQDEDTGIQSTVITLGSGMRKRITLNTTAVQQKNQAAKVLYEFAVNLQDLLGPYLLTTLELVMKLSQERYSNEVRFSSIQAMSKLFAALVMIRKNPSHQYFALYQTVNVHEIFIALLNTLMDCIQQEPDAETRQQEAECIRDILLTCYRAGQDQFDGHYQVLTSEKSLIGVVTLHPVIDEQVTKALTHCILLQSAECILRREGKEQAEQHGKASGTHGDEDKEKNVDDDGEDEENPYEEEEELLTVLVDTIGQLLKLQGPAYMPLFDTMLAPAFSAYLDPQQPTSLQIIVSCLLDDVIEFGGDAAWKYFDYVIPIFLMNSQQEKNLILRQCSYYGLAMIVQTAAKNEIIHTKYIAPLLSCFLSAMLRPDAVEENNRGITENAVFGIGNFLSNPLYRTSLLQQPQDIFPFHELCKAWLTHLPLKLDTMEAKSALYQVLTLLETNDEVMSGQGALANTYPYAIEAVRIFGDVLVHMQQIAGMVAKHSGVSSMEDDDGNEIIVYHPQMIAKIQNVLVQWKTHPMIAPRLATAFQQKGVFKAEVLAALQPYFA